jgi:diguanylate cyclase (GGDEF)-like protein/PAS domain S-box-containing protein
MTQEKSILKPSQKASFSDLFLRLIDSVFIIDPEDYKIIEMNPACERLTAKNSDQLEGLSFLDLIDPDEKNEVDKRLRMAKRRYYPLEFESKIRLPDHREIFVRISACSLEISEKSQPLQVITKNITQEKESQKVLQAYMAELKTLNEKLEILSTTDELTQLNNIRRFRARLQEETERARRYSRSYSIILFDIDHFKHYNDHHGHPAGDELLRTLGKLLKDKSRTTDFPARYGGEEFIILCTEAGSDHAIKIAERYRKIIETYPFPFATEQPLGKVSVSIGVASWPEAGTDPQNVIEAADQALYHSKKGGRNRTTSFLELRDLKPE